MTRDPYTEHMDEMLRLGGAHECGSDCPLPLPRRRPEARPTPDRAEPSTEAGRRLLSGPNMRRSLLSDVLAIEAEARASAPEQNLYDRIAASAEGSPHAEPYKLSAPVDREHAAWCWLPADHQGMCEGDQ